MDKKTVKAALDILRIVADRPTIYGIQVTKDAIYYSNGYLAIKYKTKSNVDNVWVDGATLKDWYAKATAKDFLTEFKGGEPAIDYREWFEKWVGEPDTQCAIDPNTFKLLTPFGLLGMKIIKGDSKLVQFSNERIDAIAAPMVSKVEEELC